MATNLLKSIMEMAGPDVLKGLASSLGESETKTKSAVEMALPALLGGLMKQSSTPNGMGDLFKAVNDADDGMLGRLGSMLSGGKSNDLISMGGKLLPMFFGGQSNSIVGKLVGLLGSNSAAITSLLSMLAPVLLGFLKKQVKTNNLDARGLSDLLSSQKSFLKGVPSDLTNALGIANLLGDQGGAVKPAAAQSQGNASTRRVEEAPSGPNLAWLLPLLLLGAALAAWYFWPKAPAKPANAPAVAPKAQIGMNETPAKVDLTGITEKLTSSLGSFPALLDGIKDEASATAAVDKLKLAQTGLEALKLGEFTGATRTTLLGGLKPVLDQIRGALDKAYLIPGVKAIVEPAISPIMKMFE